MGVVHFIALMPIAWKLSVRSNIPTDLTCPVSREICSAPPATTATPAIHPTRSKSLYHSHASPGLHQAHAFEPTGGKWSLFSPSLPAYPTNMSPYIYPGVGAGQPRVVLSLSLSLPYLSVNPYPLYFFVQLKKHSPHSKSIG